MPLPATTDKVMDEAIAVLDRLCKPRSAITLLSLLLAIDLATVWASGKNFYSFDWATSNPLLNLGPVLLFLAAYSLFLTVLVPALSGACSALLISLRYTSVVKRFIPVSLEPRSLPPDHVPLSEGRRHAYAVSDAAFMDRADQAESAWHQQLKDAGAVAHASFACLVLATADVCLAGENSALRALAAWSLATQGLESAVAISLQGALYFLALVPWLVYVLGDQPRIPSLYYPSLANQIEKDRRGGVPAYQRGHPARSHGQVELHPKDLPE